MYTIESGIPMPSINRSRGTTYNFHEMNVGDSFFVEALDVAAADRIVGRIAAAIRTFRNHPDNTDWKFAMRKVTERGEFGVRIWRTE